MALHSRSAKVSSKAPAPRRTRLVPDRLHGRLVGVALGLSTIWAGAATYYLVFHDEVLAGFVSQQSAMQYGYEERIGALRLQLDRTAMEQVAARDGLAQRVSELVRRQAAMESRQAQLAALAGDTATHPLPEVQPADVPVSDFALEELGRRRPAASGAKPFPTPDPLELRTRDESASDATGRQSARVLGIKVAALEQRLDGLAEAQTRAVDGIALRAGRGAQRLRGLVARLGLDPSRFERRTADRAGAAGLGGPLVPLDASDPFGLALAQAQRSVGEEARLRRVAATLPIRRPLAGELNLSSTFGARLDPFTRGYAMHTGIDMRADSGEPARATAAGRVTIADYNGGYGNMVEVDHGNGLATRYAHLSAYDVVPGQRVEAGSIIGRVGSTGRSTGNHLHYETRIDGEPVDPQRFLRAAEAIEPDLIAAR
ncbi:M23 family metallopeptidase [Methylobacterium sp. BTF04]|uniref:M23 family metallopeptidase n=1 Tax=Methylobacterium sp. BTF04 TaxID=2708300 RepID=UPI0013D1D97D|nr:M23 family metallopeptidase [Methylobacterium sp. BTF04]NEU12189.1 M23 family metallopeptidase [Methylobacterium sp. BTF04]